MCLRIEQYSCGHEIKSIHRCRTYKQKKAEATASQKVCGRFLSIFKSKPLCQERTGYRNRPYLCPICAQHAERRSEEEERSRRVVAEERERSRRREEEEAAWAWQIKNEQEQEARAFQARKRAFRCSACKDERRSPTQEQRIVNDGLCCARGMDEFDPTYRYAEDCEALADAANISPETAPAQAWESIPFSAEATRQNERRTQKSFGDVLARAAGSLAAHDYGWVQQSRDSLVEPKLMADYLNLSGVGIGNLPGQPPLPRLPATTYVPPRKPVAKPIYEDPHMDMKRWAEITQTAGHGTRPPPPTGPLPDLPKNTRKSNSNPNKPLPAIPKPELGQAATEELTRLNPGAERKVRMTSSRPMPQPERTSTSSSPAHHSLPNQRVSGRDHIARHRQQHASRREYSPISSISSAPDQSFSPVPTESPQGVTSLEDLLDEATDSWKGFSAVESYI